METVEVVWPPPPVGVEPPAIWFPYRFLDLRVEGETPDFRSGRIGIESTGMIIHSRVAIQSRGYPIYLLVFVLRDWLPRRLWLLLLAAFFAYVLLLFLFRKSMTLIVPWSQVRQIVLDEKRHRAGIVYDALDNAGKMKAYSLVFALNVAAYPSFVSAAEQYAPGCGFADRLRGESLAGLWIILLNLIVVLLGAYLLSQLLIGHH